MICDAEIHNSFESSYFGVLQSAGQYQITSDGQGLILTIDTPLFGKAIFNNYKLKSKSFDGEQLAIYPNPSHSVIYLNAKQLNISKVQIVNSFGQNIKTINNNFETLDISDLSSGIYFLKIDTEFGTINKKIIKE